MERRWKCDTCSGEHHWIEEHCPTLTAHINEKDVCSCGHSLYREHLMGGMCGHHCAQDKCELNAAFLAFRAMFQRGVEWKK